MARRRFGASHGAGHRRLTNWIGSPDTTAFTSLAAGAAVIDSSFVLINEPQTIVRVRGSIFVVSDQEIAGEQPFGAVGFAVVTDQAVAIGITAVPTPMADRDSDSWFVYRDWATNVFDTGGAAITATTGFEFQFDSKAMRKIPVESTIIAVVENADPAPGLP